ncbi:MAG: CAP domain-containing protein [Acidobacteria bacterium]|nr:CAP domain-containing protein [Acidobacteriota bacterium]
MRFTRQFPRIALIRPTRSALLLAAWIGFSSVAAYATGGTKPVARPVARLLSTSNSRQEIPSNTRTRLMGRFVPASASYAPSYAPAITVAATADERRAFDLLNAQRRARGLDPLVLDGQLTKMARYHSENMAEAGNLNHRDSDGLDTTARASLLGIHGWKALGENIAYNQGYDDPVSFVVERWMRSDKHRDNVLNGQFTHAGLGIARTSDGRVFFTQVFMTR